MATQTHQRDVNTDYTTAETKVDDPSIFLTQILVQQQQYACLKWLHHFDVLSKIDSSPDRVSVSYQEVARLAGVPERTLRAVTRMAMTSGFLTETPKGHPAHNALSRAIQENRHLRHWLHFALKVNVPTMEKLIPAVEKWGESTQSNHTAYNLFRETELPFFQFLKTRPELGLEFDEFMESQAKTHAGVRIEHLLNGFDWAALGKALVVDVGGNAGATAITLAEAFPDLHFVIQDLKGPIDTAMDKLAQLPKEISRRIEAQEHDFFSPQPVKKADVYLLRQVLHDWKDQDVAKILKQLVEAAGPNSRILIFDIVLPTPGSGSRDLEAALRQKDLMMLQCFNAKEREVAEWQTVLQEAHPRLEIKAIRRPEGSHYSVIETFLGRDPA